MALIVSQTYIASDFMVAVLPYHGRQPLEIAHTRPVRDSVRWVSAGFWTAMAGFVLLVRGTIAMRSSPVHAPRRADRSRCARTAIVMPICNENVSRVFAGLAATYDSLGRTGELAHFDFFVLSDSSNADIRVAELDAWLAMCRARRTGSSEFSIGGGSIASSARAAISPISAGAGAVAIGYMVVLDADSVMSGACLTELLRLMRRQSRSPASSRRRRTRPDEKRFSPASSSSPPAFTAHCSPPGLHFWQLGESHYWGHNAIIRVAPFMQNCALGRLPGHGTLSGEILSHDFVEAALMRRAGWRVMIAYDLAGSYEEMPPNLVDELTRDRRWCHGNLMNFRLFLMHGLHRPTARSS